MLTESVINEVLNVSEPNLIDESISSMNFYEYTPQTQSNNNTSGHQINIIINAQDVYTLPSKSYLNIKGQIRRGDNNTAYVATDEITLINNAIMYLFTGIKYELNGTTIESINYPGQVTSMLGYSSYPDDFSTSTGLSCCWFKDTSDNANSSEFSTSQAAPAAGYVPVKNPYYNKGFAARKGFLFSSDPLGCFEFNIPLSHILGFAEYQKVIYGMKHSLTLTRDSDNAALYRSGTTVNGKVDISNISWFMPQVEMAPEYLAGMRTTILEQKVTLPLSFRARSSEQITITQTQRFTWRLSVASGVERPRWLIIGFQTNRSDTQQQNPAVFDNLNLKNAHVTLNSVRYPMSDIVTDFGRNEYLKLYNMFDEFKKEYYGIDSLVGGNQVDVAAFKTLFPIIVFDVRKQNEILRTGVMDIQVRFEFGTAVPANTSAYSVIISDRFYKLSSDGKNMSVLSI
jgi:hypothetical protein